MFEAAGPFGPSTTSKDTAWLSFSDLYPAIWILLWWANRSLPPSSGVMNPKPLESLNHFTVPVDIFNFLLYRLSGGTRPETGKGSGRELTATSETARKRFGRGRLRLH